MTEPERIKPQTDERALIDEIYSKQDTDGVSHTLLQTDRRIIARVTDGIYRQPSSALRELISNAYDADATQVVIKTDAPSFSRISIEDNGLGMSPEALSNMLMHIGGSAKRQEHGKELGITSNSDSIFSPGGRKLIGKIGVGIFSVAQITHNFQIITKTKGDKYRTVALISLRQYTDTLLSTSTADEDKYEAGKVTIWREKASDIETQGTTIILTNIRPQAKETLQSKDLWDAVKKSTENLSGDEPEIVPPKYHIGNVDSNGETLLERGGGTNAIPWNTIDNPQQSFKKLVDSVWDEFGKHNRRPKLEYLFDYYLQMVWTLSLAVPLPYVQKHPFDITLDDWSQKYLLSNSPKGAATKIEGDNALSIREMLDLTDGENLLKFDVFVDDLQLFRPVKFEGLPTGGHALSEPLVMIGKCREEFSRFDIELSGGPLDFEAYLFWNPKIAPTEHQGSLIRINGSSGTLFDPSFMRYQVQEITRLSQITCEIFVHEGLDSALNIDRESFNFAHPHAVFITRWLHSALRQLATTQKRIAGGVRKEVRQEAFEQQANEIHQIALKVWKEETEDEYSEPPVVEIQESQEQPIQKDADIVLIKSDSKMLGRKVVSATSHINNEKLKAITQILASFGVLDKLPQQKQNRLLNAILNILESAE
jgi:hypothetical protein